MRKILSFLFLFSFIAVFSPLHSYADQNFNTSFDVTYTINADGLTHVVFNGTIENATDKYFATFYALQTGFPDVENITASDLRGAIKPQIKKTKEGQEITILFADRAYGIHKKKDFHLSFDTADVAKHAGSIWEINIPGVTNPADFQNFTVHLQVPSSFGKPAYIKPAHTGDSLDFDKNSLGGSGISLAFGTTQSYDFNLNYHLKNDNLFPVTTEVALPPSTNYQDVLIHTITPKPVNVTQDIDGNWLATYYLLPSQTILINAKGTAYISLFPKKEQLSNEERKLYIQDQRYWQSNASDIKKLGEELKTPENIFKYVVHHLTYDFTRVTGVQKRVGAENVLQNPSSAVCLEFTDLFIALARSAGIPAREIDGFAYTQNKEQRPLSLAKDVLHAWPEYYDSSQQEWIMVDPTWQNTTRGTDYFHLLDFDHVTFVVRGQSSTYPIPPGGYKLSDSDTSKDVFVTFGKNTKLPDPQITVSFDIAPSLFAGLPVTGNLIFKNVSERLVTPQSVVVFTPSLFPRNQTLLADAIPPFGYAQLPIQFHNTSFLTNAKETITIRVAGNTITKTISVYPVFFQKNSLIIGGIIFVIFCIGLYFIATKARRLSFFR